MIWAYYIIFGYWFDQREDDAFISPQKYAQNIISNFKIGNCNPVMMSLLVNEKLVKEYGRGNVDAAFYRSLIGSLLYLTTIRSNIMYALGLLSRCMHQGTLQKDCCVPFKGPNNSATCIKRNGNKRCGEFCLMYERNGKKMWSCLDVSIVIETVIDHMKSTFGYIFTLG